MSRDFFQAPVARRRFLQATSAAGAVGAVGVGTGIIPGFSSLTEAQAQAPAVASETVITKSFCRPWGTFTLLAH